MTIVGEKWSYTDGDLFVEPYSPFDKSEMVHWWEECLPTLKTKELMPSLLDTGFSICYTGASS